MTKKFTCTLSKNKDVTNGKYEPCGKPAIHETNKGNFCSDCWKWVLDDMLGTSMSDDLQDILNKKRKDGIIIQQSGKTKIVGYVLNGDKND